MDQNWFPAVTFLSCAGSAISYRTVDAVLSQKLYTYPANKNAFKALIAAEFNKVKIELPTFEFGVTNKTDKFVKLNPFAKACDAIRANIFLSSGFRRRYQISPPRFGLYLCHA